MENSYHDDVDFEHISSIYDNTTDTAPVVEEKISEKCKSLIMKGFPDRSKTAFMQHFKVIFDSQYQRDMNLTISIESEYPRNGVHKFVINIVEDEVLDDGSMMPRTAEYQKFKNMAYNIGIPPSWYMRKFEFQGWEYEIREINLRARTYPIICRGIKINGRAIGRVRSVKFNKNHLKDLILN